MKIRMLTTKSGADGDNWNAGEVFDREDGAALIGAGLAVAHEPAVRAERAVAAPQREPEAVEKAAAPIVNDPRRHTAPSKDHQRRK